MSNRYLFLGFFCLTIALCVLFSGCVFNPPASREAADAATATAETLFQSFNTGDYGQFSANFSAPMKAGINESGFLDMRAEIQDKYGNYTSKTLAQAAVVQGYPSFIYDCTFVKGVLKIRLVMNATDLYVVNGLWFPNGI
jgi:hypothetical protein